MNDDRKAQLHGPRYLLSVIGFSSVPRLITSVLTLISFPLLVRAVGTSDYGVFVYVSAMLTILVLFADFGVASAAGKTIAEARLRGGDAARRVLGRCARLQAIVGIAGLIPMLAISWAVASTSTTVMFDSTFLVVMVLATWASVAATFVRSCLQSYLAFGWSAVLDSVEAVVRTIGWLAVAWFAPTYTALAWATLITAVVSSGLAIAILFFKARGPRAPSDSLKEFSGAPTSYRNLIHDSASFLGVGLATRVFLSIPYIMFGQLLGADVVGVIGAFTRLLEMISFPFITIGNALAVRAYEVKSAGLQAVVALWDACFRFVVIAAGATGVFLLTSGILARVLIPTSPSGPILFSILSAVILTHSASCFIATMADFVGGLRKRILFLSVLAIVQIPILWVFVKLWQEPGAVIGYALVQVLMIGGYISSRREFFSRRKTISFRATSCSRLASLFCRLS